MTFNGRESIRLRSSKSLSKLIGHFTFQIWLKFDETEEFMNKDMDIILFKRQAEDFNLKIVKPDKLEFSRAQNVRNKTEMQLSKEISPNKWTHFTITYRQSQSSDQDGDENLGIKIFLDGEIVYEDCKLNFRKPLKETDGLIFLENYKGQFTEIRFWNANLSQQIIQQTYKKPLDCVNELRKRIKMNDDEFIAASKAKAKRGKRGTLVAPPGKGLGLKNALRRPARGSVKIKESDVLKIKKEVEDEIKEETVQESNMSDEQSEIPDLTNKSNHSQEEDTIKDRFDENLPKVDEVKEAPSKTSIATEDDFDFDFNNKSKPTLKTKPVDEFWSNDEFQTKKVSLAKPEFSNSTNFDEFEWDSKNNKNKPNISSNDFDWTDDNKPRNQKTDDKESEAIDSTSKLNKDAKDIVDSSSIDIRPIKDNNKDEIQISSDQIEEIKEETNQNIESQEDSDKEVNASASQSSNDEESEVHEQQISLGEGDNEQLPPQDSTNDNINVDHSKDQILKIADKSVDEDKQDLPQPEQDLSEVERVEDKPILENNEELNENSQKEEHDEDYPKEEHDDDDSKEELNDNFPKEEHDENSPKEEHNEDYPKEEHNEDYIKDEHNEDSQKEEHQSSEDHVEDIKSAKEGIKQQDELDFSQQQDTIKIDEEKKNIDEFDFYKPKPSPEKKTNDFDFDFGGTNKATTKKTDTKEDDFDFDFSQPKSNQPKKSKKSDAFDDFFDKGSAKKESNDKKHNFDEFFKNEPEKKNSNALKDDFEPQLGTKVEEEKVKDEGISSEKVPKQRKESVQITSEANLPPDDSHKPDDFLSECII